MEKSVESWIENNHKCCKRWFNLCGSICLVADGIKPAEIINIKIDDYFTCKKLSCLIDSIVISKNDSKVKLFVFNRNALNNVLENSDVKSALQNIGYDVEKSNQDLIWQLIDRIKNNSDFPHEIGLFLGYPVKDVLGYMGMNDLPYAKTMGWQMYGKTDYSEQLYNMLKQEKLKVYNKLENLSCTS